MPRMTLKNGNLFRDEIPMVCPFAHNLIVPTRDGGYEELKKHCGVSCPLFVVSNDQKDYPSFISLRCAAMGCEFPVPNDGDDMEVKS